MYDLLSNYFSGYRKVFLKNLSYVTLGLMRSGLASVWSIARELHHETKHLKQTKNELRLLHNRPSAKVWR